MEKISIAKVLKPKGLKGELKCKVLTEKFDLFSNLSNVICNNKTYKVISGIYRLGFAYIQLENINTIDLAENFRNKILYITKEEYGENEPDNYFIEDLIGLKVQNISGKYIGDILSIENYGATDILLIKESYTTFSVPFIKKIFLRVDLKNQIAIINQDLYEENKVWDKAISKII